MRLSIETATFTAFLLALVRAGAWVAICPPFSTRTIPVQVKVGFSVALALSVASRTAATAPTLETGPFAAALLREAAIGLALGFCVQVLFATVAAAGSLVDLFGGFTLATAYDPLSMNQASVFGRLYGLVATTLLFVVDGHVLLTRGFLRTFELTGSPSAEGAASLATSAVGHLFLAALEVAAPLVGCLFLTDVVLGLLTRSAPQLNAFQLAFPLKILLTISLAGLAVPLLPEAVRSSLEAGVTAGLRLMGG